VCAGETKPGNKQDLREAVAERLCKSSRRAGETFFGKKRFYGKKMHDFIGRHFHKNAARNRAASKTVLPLTWSLLQAVTNALQFSQRNI